MTLRGEKIVLVGAGNMATQLALALSNKGCEILQVYSRTIDSARLLAGRIGECTLYTNSIAEIVTDADLYIFSLSDSALPDVINQMQPNGALWVHTAGSMPMDVFADKCARYGVLYPMQTVNKDRVVDWSDVPIFVEASNEDDTQYLVQLSQRLSNNVSRSNSQQRQSLHLAAVFACNFSNHMYAIAERLLNEQGLDFDVMKYLIRETEHKAESISPVDGQTGPAVRNDVNVMDKHLALLGDSPEGELYRLISKNIMQYKPKQ
ncbi:MAG: DUF2520 domain-containing protein [Bacteroidaceae bacterium]|nr:DUF2520 domain-containing protein [Bacteroidaceae bacterium]